MKKFRKSRITGICFILAALFGIYFLFVMGSAVKTIGDYYAAYNMYPGAGETVAYLIQNGMTPLLSAALLFMAGCIHNEVRRLNPAYYASDEELADAKDAKREARDRKLASKAEAKAAKKDSWEETSDEEEPVSADFSAVTAPEEVPEEAVSAEDDVPEENTASDDFPTADAAVEFSAETEDTKEKKETTEN